ncbi:PREDICTED: esterase E4-like isoform X2 [Dufourea novaeangliae]|uniref:esterase E4-like isoform X2 n=1 Tax=Dufourea novaeangliae TaxID=178035 RepID=UPI000766EC21|nr:PREDICTED: esterase E4-like isoform X2 [Dufourea novaeangliae]
MTACTAVTDPEPADGWIGIRDATNSSVNLCPQRLDFPTRDYVGDEDCLYLNVYTNSLNGPKPVMFWVHGGAFISGTGAISNWGPDYLVRKDVIIVSPNYRLGAFGFLNLQHKDASGNMGLKDLILALKWVNQNIASFGGDPNNITVFGFSAGAALAHAIIVSPQSRGLFHKVILQSGTITCPWSFETDRKSFRLASLLGNKTTDTEEMIRFLKQVPAMDIVKAHASILTKDEMRKYHIRCALSIDTASENPVLPVPLEQLVLNDVNIPMIIGNTSHEFIIFLRDNTKKTFDDLNKHFVDFVKYMATAKNLDPEETEELSRIVKDWYFKAQPIFSEDNILDALEFLSDMYFTLHFKVFLENRVKRTSAPTYSYIYSYVGGQKSQADFLVKRFVKGVSHTDEMPYLFNMLCCKTEDEGVPEKGTKDREMMERLTTMWTNFAKTGNPTPTLEDVVNVTWKPATKDKLYYLEIGAETRLSVHRPHVLSAL